jgi:hypothetical protein
MVVVVEVVEEHFLYLLKTAQQEVLVAAVEFLVMEVLLEQVALETRHLQVQVKETQEEIQLLVLAQILLLVAAAAQTRLAAMELQTQEVMAVLEQHHQSAEVQ